MTTKYKIDDFVQRILSSLPSDLVQAKQDLEKNLKTALQAGFSRMDLVTREEYDVQVALLQRTREKLAELEQQVTELEKQLQKKNSK